MYPHHKFWNKMRKFTKILLLLTILFLPTILSATKPPRRVLVLAERGGLHEGFTATGLKWLESQRERLNLELTVLNSAKEIPQGELKKYQLVLQLNYPPYAWSEASMKDMERYIDKGQGGYIGFHHASLLGEFDGYPMWNWFSDFMGKIRYKNYIAEKSTRPIRVPMFMFWLTLTSAAIP